MNSRRYREWQQVAVDLGLDPENQPPDMDQPTCANCGRTLVCRPRARVCEFCHLISTQEQAA